MNKPKLAICMKDLEYQARFVNCFMNHYKNMYELHVFTHLDQLKEETPLVYAIIITGEYTLEDMMCFVERGEIILNLTEDFVKKKDALVENFIFTEKYQEVYKIAELVELLVADKIRGQDSSFEKSYEIVGVFSLTQEAYQTPFAALLGKIYGEQQKVFVLDLQTYSGFREEDASSMGLEDLLSAVTTGNHSKSRILECIRHEADWDYVCPVQNNQCLAEGSKELYDALIALLVQELGYQKIIINFGSAFLGQLDMMEQCQRIYWLCGKEPSWREEAFSKELARLERGLLLQKLQKIEIPQISNREMSWRALLEKWNWGYIGEYLRGTLDQEVPRGAAV